MKTARRNEMAQLKSRGGFALHVGKTSEIIYRAHLNEAVVSETKVEIQSEVSEARATAGAASRLPLSRLKEAASEIKARQNPTRSRQATVQYR